MQGSFGRPGRTLASATLQAGPSRPRKRLVLAGIFGALLIAIILIAATWSKVTPVNPAVAPDTATTPNPTRERK